VQWPCKLLTHNTARDFAAFQKYSHSAINAIRNPSKAFNQNANNTSTTSPETLLGRIRKMSNQQMAAIGVIGAEVVGFFTVGEMIGRLKLVGYRGNETHLETATHL